MAAWIVAQGNCSAGFRAGPGALLLPIWHHAQSRIEDRWMDQHMAIWYGSKVAFDGGFADHNIKNLSFFIDNHTQYATRVTVDVLNQRLSLFARDAALNSGGTCFKASFARWAKERVYNRLPFTLSVSLYFVWRSIFQLGFPDGRHGPVYHFLLCYWYRLLVGAQRMELARAIVHLSEKAKICAEMNRLIRRELVAQTAAPMALAEQLL